MYADNDRADGRGLPRTEIVPRTWSDPRGSVAAYRSRGSDDAFQSAATEMRLALLDRHGLDPPTIHLPHGKHGAAGGHTIADDGQAT